MQFIGGDSGPSIADLLVAAELIQAQAGRLLSSLFNFPKVAALVQNVRSLPGSLIVFAELEAFARALPPVKNAQVTIRGDREVLKVRVSCHVRETVIHAASEPARSPTQTQRTQLQRTACASPINAYCLTFA